MEHWWAGERVKGGLSEIYCKLRSREIEGVDALPCSGWKGTVEWECNDEGEGMRALKYWWMAVEREFEWSRYTKKIG